MRDIGDVDIDPRRPISDVRGILVRVDDEQLAFFRKDLETKDWIGRCHACGRDGLRLHRDATVSHWACGFRRHIDRNPIGQGPEAHGEATW